MNPRLYVGIDIAKLSFDAAFSLDDVNYHQSFSNDLAGFRAFGCWLLRFADVPHLTMEATGNYWEKLAYWAVSKGWRVSVVNPLQIHAYGKSIAQRSKTDKLDALLLARFGRNERPHVWQPPSEKARVLCALMRQLRHIRHQLNREQSRLLCAPDEIRPFISESVAYWQGLLAKVEAAVMCHIEQSSVLRKRADLLLTIPGIGKKTVPTLLAHLGDASQFSSAKKVASFAGLAPRLHESGTSVRGKTMIGTSGKSELRAALFMPALVVSFGRHKAFQPFVQRLLANGKKRKEIVIAVMRKLMTIAYAVIKSGKPYNPTCHLH